MIHHIIVTAVLFYLLTPGILLSLPPHSNKHIVAATHAIVFTVITNVYHYIVTGKNASSVFNVSSFLLFYILTPGIFLTLPPKGNKYEIAAVHSIAFLILQSIVILLVGPKSLKL
jgi:hypothetical protein